MGEAESFHRIAMSPAGNAEVKAQPPIYKRRTCRICCGVAVLLLLALVVVIVVLSQTLFKFRDPEVSIVSMKLETISVALDVLTLSAMLNISVATDVRVTNPNHYNFKYTNSTAMMFYHGQQVSERMCFRCAVLNIPFCLLSKRGDFIYLYIFFLLLLSNKRGLQGLARPFYRELETHTAIGGGGECSFQFDP